MDWGKFRRLAGAQLEGLGEHLASRVRHANLRKKFARPAWIKAGREVVRQIKTVPELGRNLGTRVRLHERLRVMPVEKQFNLRHAPGRQCEGGRNRANEDRIGEQSDGRVEIRKLKGNIGGRRVIFW